MKVIAVDNYNRDDKSDILICENVNQFYGKLIVDKLDQYFGENGDRCASLVEDDHKLYKFEGY